MLLPELKDTRWILKPNFHAKSDYEFRMVLSILELSQVLLQELFIRLTWTWIVAAVGITIFFFPSSFLSFSTKNLYTKV